MELKIRVVGATDVPKMDAIGQSDPYVVFKLSSNQEKEYKTKAIKDNANPTWNEDFTIPIHPNTNEILRVELYDEDIKNDDLISKVLLRVDDIPEGKAHDHFYTMHPSKKVKKGGGGKLRLIIEKKNSD